MSRWAAHFLVLGENAYHLHYLEISPTGNLRGVFPLTEEIAETSFLDGLLLALPASSILTEKDIFEQLWSEKISEFSILTSYLLKQGFTVPAPGERLRLFHIRLHPLTTSELCTNDCRCNRHIK